MGILKQWSEQYRRLFYRNGELQIFNIKGSHLRLTGMLLLLGLLGVLLIYAGNRFIGQPTAATSQNEAAVTLGRSSAEDSQSSSFAAYELSLAADLEKILTQIRSAGKVAVSVSLESGSEKVYAQNKTVTNRGITEKDTGGGTRVTTETDENGQMVIVRETQSGNEKLVVVKEIKPKVSGVLVVAEGAGSSQVKADLTRAVQTVLGIPAARVQVFAK